MKMGWVHASVSVYGAFSNGNSTEQLRSRLAIGKGIWMGWMIESTRGREGDSGGAVNRIWWIYYKRQIEGGGYRTV